MNHNKQPLHDSGANESSLFVQRIMPIITGPDFAVKKRLSARIVRQMTKRVHKIRSHFMIIPYIL